jgi:HEAT repeat protein
MEILREAGSAHVAAPLLAALRVARGEVRHRMIPFLAVLDAAQSAPMLRELCADRDDPECLAAVLRLLRSPEDLALVREAVAHSAWFVRVQACRALGRFGTREDLPLLSGLLGDRHWWVRYRSAEALSRLPFVPNEELRKLASLHPDAYARDMLGMWLDSTGAAR